MAPEVKATPTSASRPKPGKSGLPPGLMPVAENISAWQRVTGPAMAANWSRSPQPPIEPDKAGFYAAAIPGAAADVRGRVALCLLWCDLEAGRFCAAYLDHYCLAFTSNTTDERAAFYVAALCSAGIINDPVIKRDAYNSILSPAWQRSLYWKKFLLNADRLRNELARIFVSETDIVTPERIALVEEALNAASETSPDRLPFARYMAAAYRSVGRQDTAAETVYRFLFVNAPDDEENNSFLARAYHDHVRRDSNACAVYGRMIAQCEANGSMEEANRWTIRLAQTYYALRRADQTTLAVYEKAHALVPGDKEIEAGFIASFSRRADNPDSRQTLEVLESVLEREAEFRPYFESRAWNWALVIRAVAIAYGMQRRSDEIAVRLYARAAEANPDDRGIWEAYARALTLRGDYSATAMTVYERAIEGGQPDETLRTVLAAAYLVNNAYEGERRIPALRLWEEMYRGGTASPEMIDALAVAYTGEERANDIALMLWERAVERDPKNGPMFLRLAQEWRARSEFEKAVGYYQAAAKLLPKSFVAQYEAATIVIQQNADYPLAIKLLQKAIKMPEGTKHLGAHFALGDSLLARGQRDEAKVIFQKIVDDIDPEYTPALLNLATLNLKYDPESIKQAEALFDKALSAEPDNPETYRKLAELYREKGQHEDELAALEKYLELSPPDGDRYRQLADLYIRRGDFVRAETALRQVINLGKADKTTYILLGEVILQARQKSKANS